MTERTVARRLTTMAAGLAAATMLAACGGQEPSTGGGTGGNDAPAETGQPEDTDLVVGVLPLADLAPFYIAVEDGILQEEGLSVEVSQASGGAAQIAAMVAGDIDIAFSNYVSVLEARVQGLPLQLIRENNRSGPQGIYTVPDSGIEEPADLAGTTIAINSLGNIQELTARAVLESYGVAQDSIEVVELPPPDMPAALAGGNVEAAWLVEPFLTQASEDLGAVRVVSAFEGPTEDLPVAGWTATERYVEQNPNTVAAFVRAMDEGMRIATEQPERVAEIIPTYTSISPELAGRLEPPGLVVESDLSDFGVLADLMVEQGILDEQPDLEALVVDADELPGG